MAHLPSFTLLLTALPLISARVATCASGSDWVECDAGTDAAALGLLQMDSLKRAKAAYQDADLAGDLVLQHIPFNFGHTIEKVAGFGSGLISMGKYMTVKMNIDGEPSTDARWQLVNANKQQNAILWGHSNPDLFVTSKHTGCPLYYTPGKYWPADMAESYFGNKTIFGMLRDPYERLVAMFRGGSYPGFTETCDVNGAVRKMLKDYIAGDAFANECSLLPQAEYFDAPFGVALPVDNRIFPDSMNEVFADHGYPIHIAGNDVIHVSGCPDVWAGDLDCETKALVKQVYARDFVLLCKHFGHCDQSENSCIQTVPGMCPSNMAAKRETATHCA
mmetsp:Transcript_56965/g.144534  ORF Transcript_56965/g.144534 Transcript_56965/m.144534 type:complete len:333 (+) Transcript_56965:103-1101(+)